MEARFRIQFSWDPNQVTADGSPPPIKVGFFHPELTSSIFTEAPFSHTRKQLYRVAETFCVYVNEILKPGWVAEVNQQRLYNDETSIRRHHDHLTRVNDPIDDFDGVIIENWEERSAKRALAKTRAFELLKTLNPELAEKIHAGSAFYLQGTRYIYIVSPQSQKLSVLLPKGPMSLCVYIIDSTVQENTYDWAIAMWKYLTAAEEYTLKIANHLTFYLTDAKELRYEEENKANRNPNSTGTIESVLEGEG
jgi:hypothetical protein